ncbi:MAG: hypothetical protein DHS20C18_54040 [Saprospiraceae bacterium]|nr:MAG: hypothetical protein DHS20C18_54040 [Saprospiraceae bacterium]
MLQFKIFKLNISGVVMRFYLMMAVTLILGLLNQWALAAILGFTIAISFILGTKADYTKKATVGKKVQLIPKVEKEAAIRNAV